MLLSIPNCQVSYVASAVAGLIWWNLSYFYFGQFTTVMKNHNHFSQKEQQVQNAKSLKKPIIISAIQYIFTAFILGNLIEYTESLYNERSILCSLQLALIIGIGFILTAKLNAVLW